MLGYFIIAVITWYVGGFIIDLLNSSEKFVNFLEPYPEWVGRVLQITIYAVTLICIMLLILLPKL